MKTVLAALVAIVLVCCGKNEKVNAEADLSIPKGFAAPQVAQRPIRLHEPALELPAGTKVYLADDTSQLRVELPPGYCFFSEEMALTGARTAQPLPFLMVGTYRCVCSSDKGSTCKVFYQEDAGGFGCIHGSCSGSCTGSFSLSGKAGSISGVLVAEQPEVSARKTDASPIASLAPGARDIFFAWPLVQEKIREQYELLYSKLPRPDFEALEKDPRQLQAYVYVKAQVYGVPFLLLAPRAASALRHAVELIEPAAASCSCSNEAGGSCRMKKRGLFGYKVYWCEGSCNGCSLSVQ